MKIKIIVIQKQFKYMSLIPNDLCLISLKNITLYYLYGKLGKRISNKPHLTSTLKQMKFT